jgi:hypothetical protein
MEYLEKHKNNYLNGNGDYNLKEYIEEKEQEITICEDCKVCKNYNICLESYPDDMSNEDCEMFEHNCDDYKEPSINYYERD